MKLEHIAQILRKIAALEDTGPVTVEYRPLVEDPVQVRGVGRSFASPSVDLHALSDLPPGPVGTLGVTDRNTEKDDTLEM